MAPSRRHVLASLLVSSSLGFGGCLTLDPTVTARTGNSTVFESVSTTESWVSGRIQTSVSLAPDATTTGGVSKLAVISPSGTPFDTVTLDSGQTSATVFVPAGQNSTLVAIDTTDGTTVETRTVTAGGNELF